jgi:hypothetical protein
MNLQNVGQSLAMYDLQPLASITGPGNGPGVDLRNTDGEMAVILSAKNIAGSSPTLDVKLQESDDNSSYADVSGGAFTQVTDVNTAAAVRQKICIRADQVKRYIRIVTSVGGTSSPAFMLSVVALGVAV